MVTWSPASGAPVPALWKNSTTCPEAGLRSDETASKMPSSTVAETSARSTFVTRLVCTAWYVGSRSPPTTAGSTLTQLVATRATPPSTYGSLTEPPQVAVTGEPLAPSALMVAPFGYSVACTKVPSVSCRTLPVNVPVPASESGFIEEEPALPLLIMPTAIPGKSAQFFSQPAANGGCSSDFWQPKSSPARAKQAASEE